MVFFLNLSIIEAIVHRYDCFPDSIRKQIQMRLYQTISFQNILKSNIKIILGIPLPIKAKLPSSAMKYQLTTASHAQFLKVKDKALRLSYLFEEKDGEIYFLIPLQQLLEAIE